MSLLLFVASYSLMAMQQPAAQEVLPVKINENVKLFLGKVINRTNFNLNITELSGIAGGFVEIAKINPTNNDGIILNIPVPLKPHKSLSSNESYFRRDLNIVKENAIFPYLSLLILYDENKNQIKIQGMQHVLRNGQPINVLSREPLHIINLSSMRPANADIYIDLIIDGENLETMRILSRIESRPVPPLKEQTVKAIGQRIKAGTLTVDQAKKNLPADLQEALDNYLQKNQ